MDPRHPASQSWPGSCPVVSLVRAHRHSLRVPPHRARGISSLRPPPLSRAGDPSSSRPAAAGRGPRDDIGLAVASVQWQGLGRDRRSCGVAEALAKSEDDDKDEDEHAAAGATLPSPGRPSLVSGDIRVALAARPGKRRSTPPEPAVRWAKQLPPASRTAPPGPIAYQKFGRAISEYCQLRNCGAGGKMALRVPSWGVGFRRALGCCCREGGAEPSKGVARLVPPLPGYCPVTPDLRFIPQRAPASPCGALAPPAMVT